MKTWQHGYQLFGNKEVNCWSKVSSFEKIRSPPQKGWLGPHKISCGFDAVALKLPK